MAQIQNNYFSTMIRRFNDNDFVKFLKPEQIQKSAKERIFREMVRGQIDYVTYGSYFVETKFLENLLIAADNELKNNETIYTALRYYDLSFPGQPNVTYNLAKYYALVYIFQNINNRLYNIKMTGDIGYLADLQYTMTNYKNYM